VEDEEERRPKKKKKKKEEVEECIEGSWDNLMLAGVS
jgi:hypothetical protein